MAAQATTGSTVLCGFRAVAAVAVQGDVYRIGRAHEGAAGEAQVAGGEAGHVVHGEHRVAGETLKQAVFNHHSGAAAAFFRRLKDQVQRAAEVRLPRQIARRRQQHGGVPVVAAGVHHPGMGAGVRQAGRFGNRQGVHVGADAE